MMKSTFEDGLPSASSRNPQASRRKIRKVSGAGVSIRSTKVIRAVPIASRLPQRAIDATTSSLVTGLPS